MEVGDAIGVDHLEAWPHRPRTRSRASCPAPRRPCPPPPRDLRARPARSRGRRPRRSPRLRVNLGDQRAGGVDHVEPALRTPAAVPRARPHACGEDHGRAVRNLVELLDEHGAASLEVSDDAQVVDDLLADRRRGAPRSASTSLDDLDGAHHLSARCSRRAASLSSRSLREVRAHSPTSADAPRSARCRLGHALESADRPMELVAVGVEHDSQRYQRFRARVRREPRRFHVDRECARAGEARDGGRGPPAAASRRPARPSR